MTTITTIRLRMRTRTTTPRINPGRGGDNDTIDGSKSNQQSTNNAKWRGGGAMGR
jgi:hypothetical protein